MRRSVLGTFPVLMFLMVRAAGDTVFTKAMQWSRGNVMIGRIFVFDAGVQRCSDLHLQLLAAILKIGWFHECR